MMTRRNWIGLGLMAPALILILFAAIYVVHDLAKRAARLGLPEILGSLFGFMFLFGLVLFMWPED